MSGKSIAERLSDLRIAVIVPTYNNYKTITRVVDSLLEYTSDIIVVNDGSTDSTSELLKRYIDKIKIIQYSPNQGKGYALVTGFKKAMELGFRYALTIDSDGQHYASDMVNFVTEIEQYPDSFIVGSRLLQQENMSGGSTFANKFSNFWYRLQTGINLPDTQSGYRLYPLAKMGNMKIRTSRYEAELEMLVFSAWRGIDMRPIKISVYYAPKEEKVSHFRPFQDFFRISVLNSVLVLLAIVYGYPRTFIRKLLKK